MVYSGGVDAAAISENPYVTAAGSLFFLWLITLLHVRGLGTGKWLNNIGAVGTWFGLLILLAIGVIVLNRAGTAATPFHAGTLLPSFRDYVSLSAVSITMYSLVGLELGSVMGGEIKNTRKIIRKAVFLAGTISILLYLMGTASLLLAVPAEHIGAIQGLMQAVTLVSVDLNLTGVIPFVAVLLSFAVLGVCSAWISGAARIPFVMGMDVYLPPVLGRIHGKWGSPHVALLVQATLSSLFILISLYGSFVREAYEFLLKSSVVIQLIPFLYLFLGLWKLKRKRFLAFLGVMATSFGILFVFIPSSEIENKLRFELQLLGSCSLMLGLAVLFYKIGKRKQALKHL
jgi:amino acid transporter